MNPGLKVGGWGRDQWSFPMKTGCRTLSHFHFVLKECDPTGVVVVF